MKCSLGGQGRFLAERTEIGSWMDLGPSWWEGDVPLRVHHCVAQRPQPFWVKFRVSVVTLSQQGANSGGANVPAAGRHDADLRKYYGWSYMYIFTYLLVFNAWASRPARCYGRRVDLTIFLTMRVT